MICVVVLRIAVERRHIIASSQPAATISVCMLSSHASLAHRCAWTARLFFTLSHLLHSPSVPHAIYLSVCPSFPPQAS